MSLFRMLRYTEKPKKFLHKSNLCYCMGTRTSRYFPKQRNFQTKPPWTFPRTWQFPIFTGKRLNTPPSFDVLYYLCCQSFHCQYITQFTRCVFQCQETGAISMLRTRKWVLEKPSLKGHLNSEITMNVKNRYLPDRCILRYLNHF